MFEDPKKPEGNNPKNSPQRLAPIELTEKTSTAGAHLRESEVKAQAERARASEGKSSPAFQELKQTQEKKLSPSIHVKILGMQHFESDNLTMEALSDRKLARSQFMVFKELITKRDDQSIVILEGVDSVLECGNPEIMALLRDIVSEFGDPSRMFNFDSFNARQRALFSFFGGARIALAVGAIDKICPAETPEQSKICQDLIAKHSFEELSNDPKLWEQVTTQRERNLYEACCRAIDAEPNKKSIILIFGAGHAPAFNKLFEDNSVETKLFME